MRQLIDYLPDCLKNIEEYRAIFNAQQIEINDMSENRMQILHNLFVETADEVGLDFYEKMYGLRSNKGLTADERKFALQTAILDKRPATYNFLVAQLNTICGKDGFELSVNYSNYSVLIKIALAQKSKFSAVKKLLAKIIPANMDITIQISYNRYRNISLKKYNELEDFDFTQLREEILQEA